MSVLARPGTPIEQGVAAAEDRHEQLLDHLLLADDDLADFLLSFWWAARSFSIIATSFSTIVLMGNSGRNGVANPTGKFGPAGKFI